MSATNRRNLIDIISLNPNDETDFNVLKTEYRAVDIDKVIIDENPYTNYGAYSFVWEKTYVKAPERSSGGVIANLNSHSTFLTGHFVIDFSVISIDDYRKLMQQHYEKNEFVVKCYDPIYNKTIKLKMYFATEEMAKLYTINKKIRNKEEWEDWIILAGVREYTLEMISTNADLDLVGVTYHRNPPQKTGQLDQIQPDQTQGEPNVYKGEEIIIGESSDFKDETFGGAYKFSKWNTQPDGSGLNYIDGYAYTINEDLVLYAQWESQESHILTYNYGLADPVYNDKDYSYVTSKTVVKGQSIGELPSIIENPFVEIDGVKYEPYGHPQWYKTPIRQDDKIVNNFDNYWSDRDSTIYLLFLTQSYQLLLIADDVYDDRFVEYNSPIMLPKLEKPNYTFDGWYTTPDYQEGTKFSGKMPPKDLTLYARWVKQ